jgi:hypothetical protein
VLTPNRFLPEAPDLPELNADLFTEIPGGGGKKYWEYACVLIALFKAEGFGRVQDITGTKVPNDIVKAVHALHKYYIGEKIQYDDGSQRNKVMNRWGYRLAFSGLAHWEELPAHVELKKGTYIFDIVGHTVKVNVLQDISETTKITKRADFFEPDSHPSNFTRGNEFKDQVTAIWKKG